MLAARRKIARGSTDTTVVVEGLLLTIQPKRATGVRGNFCFTGNRFVACWKIAESVGQAYGRSIAVSDEMFVHTPALRRSLGETN